MYPNQNTGLLAVYCGNIAAILDFECNSRILAILPQKNNSHHNVAINCGFQFPVNSNICKKLYITKTYLYNFDPLKPHFYIVKLGFTGVYIIFLISAQNMDCGYTLEPPRRGGSNEYYNLCFEQKYEKYLNFFV